MRPVDGVTLDEAARIVGCSSRTLARHIEGQVGGRHPFRPGRYSIRTVAISRRFPASASELLAHVADYVSMPLEN